MEAISVITTVCFVILVITRSKFVMHLVIYLENKILFYFICQFYFNIIPKEFHTKFSTDTRKFTVYFPFYPMFDFLNAFRSKHIRKEEDFNILGIFLFISGMITLSMLITAILWCINRYKRNKWIKIIVDNVTCFNIWYGFATSLLFPFSYLGLYTPTIAIFLALSGDNLLYFLYNVTVLYIILLLLLLYALIKSIPEVMNQFFTGESRFGSFGASFMDYTKPNIQSRALLCAWLVKIIMTQLTNLSNELFSTGFLFEQFDYQANQTYLMCIHFRGD